jgi:hypothetical protein
MFGDARTRVRLAQQCANCQNCAFGRTIQGVRYLRTVTMKITDFWDVMPCGLVGVT